MLILLRGLPGSGKTTFAKTALHADALISIDDHFTNPTTGEYEFNYKENHKAYAQCKARVEEVLKSGKERVVVHNTFVSSEELWPYFSLAEQYNYVVFVLTVENYHAGRNVHGISDDQIRKMAEKFSIKLY